MSSLNDFKQFIGRNIKNPDRLTCDTDPVADAIQSIARKNMLRLVFQKAGEPSAVMPALPSVIAHIEPAGTSWRVTDFNLH